jgi:hypothetical protein
MTELADRDATTAPASALPQEYYDVLAYLVPASDHDPDAHCVAVTSLDLYHLDPDTSERVRSGWAFLWNVLLRMENRGLVVRSTMREDMIGTSSRAYTVARITEAGRQAYACDARTARPAEDSGRRPRGSARRG